MATITKPIALNETFKTSESTSRNVADVLAEELRLIAENILPPNAEDIAYDNTASGLTATNVQDAIDEVISSQADVIADTMADLTENKTATVTDGVADFETIDGSLVKSLVVEIESSQSGSGTPSPDNIRPITGWTQEDIFVVGKNRLPITATSQTIGGVTFTVNSDGTITVNGTATAYVSLTLYDANFSCPYNGYILSGCPSGGSNTTYEIRVSDIDTTSSADYGEGRTINLTDTGRWRVLLIVRNGTTVNNLVFKPMIRLATSSADFEPYKGKTYTIPFGQTVYGGTLDVLTGELTIDKGFNSYTWADGTNATSRGNNITSKMFTLSEQALNKLQSNKGDITNLTDTQAYNTTGNVHFFINNENNLLMFLPSDTDNSQAIQICYALATPTTLSLTPQTVKALVGENHISASTGDVLECKFSMLINGDDLAQIIGG